MLAPPAHRPSAGYLGRSSAGLRSKKSKGRSSKACQTVGNTGQSVPAEQVPALFEPFRRRTADRTDHSAGAGLGLSIVRSITTAHGGTVRARPRPGGGLIVEIDLPPAPSPAGDH